MHVHAHKIEFVRYFIVYHMKPRYLKHVDVKRKRIPPEKWRESDKRVRMSDLLDDLPDEIKRQFKYDDYSLWSFTHLAIGDEICRELLKLDGISARSTVTDAMSSIGGNTIAFARVFAYVNAVEIDDDRRDKLEHNLELCGLENVKIYASYYQYLMGLLKQDIIFIDPPWGIDYRKQSTVRLSIDGPFDNSIPTDLESFINELPEHKYCVVKLPFNYDLEYMRKRVKGKIIRVLEYPRPNTCIVVIIEFHQIKK